MLGFKKKIADPAQALSTLVKKINDVSNLSNITERTEQLLSLKESLDNTRKALDADGMRGAIAGSVVITAAFVGIAVIFTPAVAIVAGILLGGGAFAVRPYITSNLDRIFYMEQKINKEITALIGSNPQEVANSPKFQQSIKSGFNYAASTEKDFMKLTAYVALKATASL